jgi:hypothetical protein
MPATAPDDVSLPFAPTLAGPASSACPTVFLRVPKNTAESAARSTWRRGKSSDKSENASGGEKC